ncbi:MAG: ABC transporter permease [Chloroflexi bacterium]|nr:ABC transporter permease [Chloroflexota bacterium]
MSLSTKRLGVFRVLRGSSILGPLAALLLAIFFFSSQTDRFLTGTNLSLVVQQVIVVGALAIGQTLVILTSGIDLSCGMVMALSQVLRTSLAVNHGVPPLLAILLGMLVCLGFGFLNGFLVTTVHLPPFIVTLGTVNIAFATMIIYTTQTITGLPDIMLFLGSTFKIGSTAITYGSVLLVVLYLIMWFVLRSTVFGRYIYAVGDNPEAARLAGIPTTRILIAVYMLAAFFYGIAALFFIARTEVGDPRAGENLNLEAITAVVLGGTSLFGGRGNIMGTFIGALTVGVFRNGLQLMGLPSIAQVLITGVLVILAVSIDQLSRRGK